MKPITFSQRVAVALLVVAGCTSRIASANEPDSQTHDGAVVSAAAGKLVISSEGGKQETFSVGDAVPITVNGEMGKLEDLKKGMLVRVIVDREGKVMAINTIDRDKNPC
jgi:hypothetical protein